MSKARHTDEFGAVKNTLHFPYHDRRSHGRTWPPRDGREREHCERAERGGGLNGQREQRFIRDALLLDLRANENG